MRVLGVTGKIRRSKAEAFVRKCDSALIGGLKQSYCLSKSHIGAGLIDRRCSTKRSTQQVRAFSEFDSLGGYSCRHVRRECSFPLW